MSATENQKDSIFPVPASENVFMKKSVAVVIPAYKAKKYINGVINDFFPLCDMLIVVDDACPDSTGKGIDVGGGREITILTNKLNLGVGGATKVGFEKAIKLGFDIIVKVDSDGQMDPKYFNKLIKPLQDGRARFSKGNRFHNLGSIKSMPVIRLFGNSILSFVNRLVSGYWNVMDPTNGYFAIEAKCLKHIGYKQLENGYFFESDLICKLGINRIKISEVPMSARYGNESSNLSILKVSLSFPYKFMIRFVKRLFYSYLLREINPGSIALLLGGPLVFFGVIFGLLRWIEGYVNDEVVSSGTVMLAALPILLGGQFLMFFLQYDIDRNSRLLTE